MPMDKITTTIKPVAPFDFELTAGYHTYFRGRYGTDSLDGGVYRRLLDLGDRLALVSVRSTGSIANPELAVEVRGEDLSPQNVIDASRQVMWVLGAGEDLTPFYAHAQGDPALSDIVHHFYGLHLPHTATVFEALVLAILGQQIATAVARIARTLLIETYGLSQTFDDEVHYAFPRPESLSAASVADLRRLKLSQRKAEYVRGIAAAALDGSGWLGGLQSLEDAEVVRRVTQLRGVGHWTAQWLLVRGLGRPDAFPSGDLALQRAISNLYFSSEKLSAAQIEEFSQRWSPFRTYATAYLFTALRAGMA
ncbi:MAG TPA: DNA-3-methyladenine glycosylase [Dehalococcoidia bacterium]|nr:DNA-3-methyladenine glycosylase [Dehalococcoidia bacterium]